jgi:hypothetical protein
MEEEKARQDAITGATGESSSGDAMNIETPSSTGIAPVSDEDAELARALAISMGKSPVFFRSVLYII